jgi:hypothetical protein
MASTYFDYWNKYGDGFSQDKGGGNSYIIGTAADQE